MWERLLVFPYEDYELEANRRSVLQIQVKSLISNLQDAINDRTSWLDTDMGAHIDGTEEQSESPLWHKLRSFRVTGTTFKGYATNPVRMAKALWQPKADISQVRAIKWGRDHEDDARKEYERDTRSKVVVCGIFVSKKNPLFAASPDGVIISSGSLAQSTSAKGLLEIKCPFSLKDVDLNSMTTAASSQFFNCHEDGKLTLKQHHSYYFQIQLGMYVSGCTFTDFVI
jgi:hypothetical protein